MKVQLGVYNIQYGAENRNTTDVAGYLEKNYKLMSNIAEKSMSVISREVSKKMIESAFHNIGADEKLPDTKYHIKQLIGTQSFDGKLAGVPTQVAIKGYKSKFVGGKRKRYKLSGPRPSFIDTGYFIKSLDAKLVND